MQGTATQACCSHPLVRRVVDAVLRGRARRRLSELEHGSAVRLQAHVLSDLVRRAQRTSFGRDHDFSRIRSAADFRRLVPLATVADLWQRYWQPSFPCLDGVTWPGRIRYLAVPSTPGPPTLSSSAVPVSAHLLATHRAALWTTLSLVLEARPRSSLFRGQLLFAGSGTSPLSLETDTPPCSLEEAALAGISPFVSPSLRTLPDPIEPVQRLADLPVTCLVGETDHLLPLLTNLRNGTGQENLQAIWPDLTAILHTGSASGPGREQLAEVVGASPGKSPVLLVEVDFLPEAVVAVEDPRHGLLRLLPDHGVYFEFVPVEEAQRPEPVRHSLAEVETHVPYRVVVSSPAGLWACRTSLTVCFEQRDPPLLRRVPVEEEQVTPPPDTEQAAPAPLAPPRADAPLAPLPVQTPHPRPSRLPVVPVVPPWRGPWSIPVD